MVRFGGCEWIETEHTPITLESVRDMVLATRGVRLFQVGGDLGFMRHGAQELIQELYKPDGKGGMEIPY